MRKFNQALDMTDNSTLPPVTEEERDKEQCPACCGHVETRLHYIHCGALTMTKTREGLQCEFKRTLQKMKTYPGIISTLVAALQAYSREKEVSLDVTDFRGPIDNMILLAIDE